MSVQNSLVSFYGTLVKSVYRDIAECYTVATSVQKVEIDLIDRRLDKEGLSFLTKTLPAFGKAIDTALSTGRALSVPAFKKRKDSQLPRFLGWLLEHVFCNDGVEHNSLFMALPGTEIDACVALRHLRNFLYILYKLEIPHDENDENRVLSEFVQTDAALVESDEAIRSSSMVRRAGIFCASVFGTLDPLDVSPRHGPGAVATGEKTVEKAKFARIYSKLEQVYPFTEYFCYNMSHVVDCYQEFDSLELLDEATAKVVLVPKDSRGPRLISCEPLEIQWIQQGLGRRMVSRLENHPLTSGHVNFTCQDVNRSLALSGSTDGQWVTLDMKEASDRVSLTLVECVFSRCPELLSAMIACRSSRTQLPCGTIVDLKKFAPMGSCLCFPVESFCFYALIVSALMETLGYSRRKALERVYVYGDDIIMRVEDYDVALQHLPSVGLKFNLLKCCTHGFFRESCGMDAYRGVCVTPVRVRTVWCHHRKAPEVLTSYVALRNALYGIGYYRSAQFIKAQIKRVYGRLPWTQKFDIAPNGAWIATSSAPAYATESVGKATNLKFKKRLNRYFRIEVKTYYSEPVKARSTDSWWELLRRHSAGFPMGGGAYALPRRNRLKRGFREV
jgi:hypothetical protein